MKRKSLHVDPTNIENTASKIVEFINESNDQQYRNYTYDCFLLYRTEIDRDVAEKLYLNLRLLGCKPFWSKTFPANLKEYFYEGFSLFFFFFLKLLLCDNKINKIQRIYFYIRYGK